MSTVVKLEEIAGRLQDYQEQMAGLNDALEALKKVGELISMAMAEDRNCLIGLAVQMHDDATEVVGASTFPADATIEPATIEPATIEPATIEPATIEPATIEPATIETAIVAANSEVVDARSSVEATEADRDCVHSGGQGSLVLEPVTADALAAIAAVAAATGSPVGETTAEAPAGDVTDTFEKTSEAAEMTKAVEDTLVLPSAQPAKVVDMASRRRKPSLPLPSRRRSLGFAAGLLVLAVGGTIGQEVLQGDLFQRLMDLGSCDGEALSANQDCALLAWMLL